MLILQSVVAWVATTLHADELAVARLGIDGERVGLCNPLIEKHEGAANRGNVDGQIGTVENQDLGVQYAIHGRYGRISHRLLSLLDMGRREPGVVLSKYRAAVIKSNKPKDCMP